MKCKKIIFVAVVIAVAAALVSAVGAGNTPQEEYIRKYAPVAVREMYRSGVPASITLAQGLLESRYGQSELAVDGNNHFGIKCHDWTGRKVYHDDDKRHECFRAYKSPDESFSDHSDFLRYRDRYKSLFDNDVTDYKAWAHGLRKAGYATDPSYPSKLIKLIEDYHLYDYDKMTPEDFSAKKPSDNHETAHSVRKGEKANANSTASVPGSRHGRKASRKASKDKVNADAPMSIPRSPLSLEEPEKVSGKRASEIFSFPLARQIYSNNGVPFIYSADGESYGTIASSYNLFLREILKFNDVSRDAVLAPGTMVYLQQKKSQTRKGLDMYISDDGGETMRDLAQRFGVRLSDLCKMNSIHPDHVTVPGDEIRLRK